MTHTPWRRRLVREHRPLGVGHQATAEQLTNLGFPTALGFLLKSAAPITALEKFKRGRAQSARALQRRSIAGSSCVRSA
jgi:hypothetical protein